MLGSHLSEESYPSKVTLVLCGVNKPCIEINQNEGCIDRLFVGCRVRRAYIL